jgi:hypothetical protein
MLFAYFKIFWSIQMCDVDSTAIMNRFGLCDAFQTISTEQQRELVGLLNLHINH